MERQGKQYLGALIVTTVLTVLVIAASFLSSMISLSGLLVSSEIEKHTFTVEVQENGVMDIYEEINYNLSDANGVLRTYEYKSDKKEKIELQSVTINDGKEVKKVDSARNGNKGVYTYVDSGRQQEVKIYQPTDGNLKVKLHYSVTGMITEYNDMQALDWTFYDSREGTAPLNMTVNVKFPTDIQKENMKVFGHGDLDGTVFPTSASTVDVDIPVFRKDTFGTLVVLLPTKPLTEVTNIVKTDKYQEALDFELKAAGSTNDQIVENAASKEQAEMIRIIALAIGNALLIISIPLGFFYFRRIYLKYDKEQYEGELDYYRDVPGTYGPAVAALVLDPDKEPDQEQLAATIFSLFTKNIIKIETLNKLNKKNKDEEEVYITVLDSPVSDLPNNEKIVYTWLSEFADGKEFLYKDFLCDNDKKDLAEEKAFIKNYERFQQSVKREFKTLKYLEHSGVGQRTVFTHAIFALVLMVTTVAVIFIASNIYLGIVLGIGTILLFAMNIILYAYQSTCYRFTLEGAEEHDKCKALKKFLEDFSALNEAPIKSAALWQQYFVYGLALGVNDAALENLYAKLPREQMESSNINFTTIYMMNRLMTYHHFRSYSYGAVNQTSSRIAAAEAQISRSSGGSSFGGGGGFSGGGSFGGGGGGGGSSSF